MIFFKFDILSWFSRAFHKIMNSSAKKEDKYMRFGPIDSKLKLLELELGTFLVTYEITE